jgi:hypothetical protein
MFSFSSPGRPVTYFICSPSFERKWVLVAMPCDTTFGQCSSLLYLFPIRLTSINEWPGAPICFSYFRQSLFGTTFVFTCMNIIAMQGEFCRCRSPLHEILCEESVKVKLIIERPLVLQKTIGFLCWRGPSGAIGEGTSPKKASSIPSTAFHVKLFIERSLYGKSR